MPENERAIRLPSDTILFGPAGLYFPSRERAATGRGPVLPREPGALFCRFQLVRTASWAAGQAIYVGLSAGGGRTKARRTGSISLIAAPGRVGRRPYPSALSIGAVTAAPEPPSSQADPPGHAAQQLDTLAFW